MKYGTYGAPEGCRVETVLVVIFFALFSAVVAFIIRPRNRRRSRRPVALSAATDSPRLLSNAVEAPDWND